jgi:hypothetical protein
MPIGRFRCQNRILPTAVYMNSMKGRNRPVEHDRGAAAMDDLAVGSNRAATRGSDVLGSRHACNEKGQNQQSSHVPAPQ